MNMSREKHFTAMDQHKQWWAPIWTGLIMDPEATHYKRMRNALWLYLYLVLNANRKTGRLVRKLRTISLDMGISRDLVLRWLGLLRTAGYISTQNTGRCLLIEIRKWKSLSAVVNPPLENRPESNYRSGNNPVSPAPKQTEQSAYPKPEPVRSTNPNDMSLKERLLKIDIEKKYGQGNSATTHPFTPTTREELLALDLAVGLDDQQSFPFYLACAKKYPEAVLRALLGTVQEIPQEKIKKSRGALFHHLLKKQTHDETGHHHSGS